MAKTPDANSPEDSARFEVTDAKRKSAKRWFDQAKKLVEQRNYDYAIKSFTEGLAQDPEAVEEGWQPLRGCGVARMHTGGKKPSMMDTVKYSTTQKDPIKGLVNAAWLLAHDPNNAKYAEDVMRNANKAHCDRTVAWVGPVLRECLGAERKPNPKKFTLLKEIYEEMGERCEARGEAAEATIAYECGIEALSAQRSIDPKNRELDNIIRNLSTKLTILKGNYQEADSFRDSVQDSDSQARMHDVDRMVQSDESLQKLLTQAQADIEANPGVEAKVIAYVDLLAKDETDAHEKEAIKVLMQHYEAEGQYRYKQRADDFAVRQMNRHARLAKKAGDSQKWKELTLRRLKFELGVLKERINKYPTDLRLKYEYARRLFEARKFDDAIPLFQQARSDPKARHSCNLYLGRCFFEQKMQSQAINTLQEAIEGYELTDDTVAKELNYWLGRAQEAGGQKEEARQTFGKLLQVDYNYRDVRARIADL